MTTGNSTARFEACLTVPWDGSRQAWDQVSGQFTDRLAQQVGGQVISARADVRTGGVGDVCLSILITITVSARGPRQATDIAQQVFGRATGGDPVAWRGGDAKIRVRPAMPLVGKELFRPSLVPC
jgi:hypothetical protein